MKLPSICLKDCNKKSTISGGFFLLAASPGLGTPAKAGPPRAVNLKLRISLSDLLSSTLVFANYPLRTKILVLAMTSAPQQKNPPFQVDFFCWLLRLDSNQD